MCLTITTTPDVLEMTKISDKYYIFGTKKFFITNGKLTGYYRTNKNYTISYEEDGIRISAPLKDQYINVYNNTLTNNPEEINEGVEKTQLSIMGKKLGIHFNTYIEHLKCKKEFYSLMKYYNTHYPEIIVCAEKKDLQVTGMYQEAIAKSLLIPNPKLFNKYVNQISDKINPKEFKIKQLKESYKYYYGGFIKCV